MLHYKKILAATCLTPNSDEIITKAHQLAEDSGASLDIVHVLEQTAASYGGEFSTMIDVEYEHTLEKHLQQLLAEQAQKFGIAEDQRYLEKGAIKHAIIDLATQLDCDLIVVGSHSHHGLEKLLGSKANAILHLAKCDVLTVRINE